MLPRVSALPPYEWIVEAIEKVAAKDQLELAPVKCELLSKALDGRLQDIRVYRTYPARRGLGAPKKKRAKTPMVDSTSMSAEYARDLPDLLEEALLTLRKQHIERAKIAWTTIVNIAGVKDVAAFRGARFEVEIVEGKPVPAVALQIAGKLDIAPTVMIDACGCATDDMVLSDVLRALWATALEARGLAPRRWTERFSVGVGWPIFQKRSLL